MRQAVAGILLLALSASAFVAPIRPPVRSIVSQAPGHQLVVLRGANDDSLFSSEKIGKAAFIMIPFAWGVVDWAHPPWYDVVLEAFRG